MAAKTAGEKRWKRNKRSWVSKNAFSVPTELSDEYADRIAETIECLYQLPAFPNWFVIRLIWLLEEHLETVTALIIEINELDIEVDYQWFAHDP